MALHSGSSIRRGDLLVIADTSSSYGTGGGYSTARLAVATSVSRDGSELRAYRTNSDSQPTKWDHASRHAVWAVVPGSWAGGECSSTAVVREFSHPHSYTQLDGVPATYRSAITVFGPEGDEGMVAAARYLRDAVSHWQDTGEIPAGHNPEHPESVHLSHQPTKALA